MLTTAVHQDVLPAIYFLSLFLLDQFRFLEIQEAHIFELEAGVMKQCPTATFRSQDKEYELQALLALQSVQVDIGHDCAICQLEPIGLGESVYRLTCNHQFHRYCLLRWLNHQGAITCPLCRVAILDKNRCLSHPLDDRC